MISMEIYKNMFVAYYQPADNQNLTKDFKTKKQAEKYIISNLCGSCKKEKDQLGSPCGMEWLLISHKKYLKAKTHFDLMEAAGWKKVYGKQEK